MSKRSCDMAADLLPLYVEDLCSEESRAFVAEHLAECDACKEKLKKMNTEIAVHADDDISTIKRIKKRIAIERIAVAAIVGAMVLVGGWFAGFFLTSTAADMNYEKEIAGNIRVEEDASGDLWLVRSDRATAADTCFPTIRDEQGRHMGYDKDFDSSTKEAFGITLDQARISALSPFTMTMKQQRMQLFNKNEKPDMQQVFYYDADNNREIVLWERS